MTCAELRLRLDDYVGGLLSEADAAALESHLESCAACEALLAAEAAPVEAIRALPRAVSPREDLWPGIGARLARREPGLRRRVAVPRWMLAAAAVLLIAVSSGATALLLNRGPSRLPVLPSSRLASLEAEYLSATQDLSAALDRARSRLAPETLASIDKSLSLIDAALEESRVALANDPGNEALRMLLVAAWRQKVDLLRRATGGVTAL
jgi:anti-sigma factor RsiW